MTQSEFSTAKGKEFIKSVSDKRVSKDAANEFAQQIEKYAYERAEDIVEKTNERNRVTVRAEDVQDTR